jgi:diketogulonate reductase-like aldo/keto reductase
VLDKFPTVPAVNQVELHPLLAQKELRAFCAAHGIQIEAWSPLMQGHLDIPALVDIAKKHGKSPAQVVIRWDLQSDIVTIPKSVHEARIIANADVFDFELSADEMAVINALDRGHRFGPDPDNFNF